jgi:hypothetical protein
MFIGLSTERIIGGGIFFNYAANMSPASRGGLQWPEWWLDLALQAGWNAWP